MNRLIRWSLVVIIVVAGSSAFAASATDFYTTLLQRGIAAVEAGQYETAVTPLRLAAFGLVESIEHYETAQAYLTVAFDKLGKQESARDAAQRVLSAERVERKFASLALPQSIRTAFDAVARKVLPSADAASLTAPVTTPKSTTPPPANIKPVPETKPPVQTTTPPKQTTTTTKPVIPPPAQSAPPKPKPQPAATTSANTAPATTTPVNPQPPRIDIPSRLAAAERALGSANLAEARRIYRELLDAPGVDHATSIRIGEGFYRARDFANVMKAFQRAGTFRAGEEAYHYYLAVAAYETGDYERARRELATALPHIELTDDVQRYRTKIESAR